MVILMPSTLPIDGALDNPIKVWLDLADRYLMITLFFLCLNMAHAELDQHQQKGLSDTKTLLKSSAERDAYIKTDKRAQDVDDKVSALAGSSENKEEIYGIAAQVMEKMTQEANGDPAKMQRLLMDAQTNPEAFYGKYFSDQDKAAVRGVANKIDSKKAAVAPK